MTCAVLLAALPASARDDDEPWCGSSDKVAEYLKTYGESVAYEQPVGNTRMVWQFWTPEDGKSWTVVVRDGETSCIMSDGGRPELRGEPI